eukprot:TRINITY_DN60401_c0_g2_i1.p1 TRINITY_DN60401_c0_g2~~TRINITY_DN60401_c0_g2_i1.p1  ORF type:complete len:648 (+),score=252.42 TRINITY_DN60401_c0_g2_i1:151-2094(+)
MCIRDSSERLKAEDPRLYNEVRHLKAMHSKHELTVKGSGLVRAIADKYARLKERLRDVLQENHELKIQLMEISRLQQELAECEAELEAARHELSGLRIRVPKLEEELDTQKREYEHQVGELRGQIQTLRDEMAKERALLQSMLDELQRQFECCQSREKEANLRNNHLEQQLVEVNSELTKVAASLEQEQEKLADMGAHVERLHSENKQQASLISQLQAELASAEEKARVEHDRAASEARRADDAEAHLVAEMDRSSRLEAELGTVRRSVESLRAEHERTLVEFNHHKQQAAAESARDQTTIQELTRRLHEADGLLGELKTDRDRLDRERSELAQQLSDERVAAEEALGQARAQLSRAEAGEEAAKKEVLKMEVEIEKLLAEIRQLREQVLGERAAHERALGELTSRLDEAARTQQRVAAELRGKEQVLEETKNILSSERQAFQHKMGELKEKVESLSHMMETTLSRNRKLEEEVERLRVLEQQNVALERMVTERTAAANEARSREQEANQDKARVVAETEAVVATCRKDLENARGRELELEAQVHEIRMQLARLQGSNSELAHGLESARTENHSLQTDLEYVKTHSMVDWVDRTVHQEVTHSADRIGRTAAQAIDNVTVSYTHLRAHETPEHLVCRLLLEKKKKNKK